MSRGFDTQDFRQYQTSKAKKPLRIALALLLAGLLVPLFLAGDKSKSKAQQEELAAYIDAHPDENTQGLTYQRMLARKFRKKNRTETPESEALMSYIVTDGETLFDRQITRYIRTVTVLDQCGSDYAPFAEKYARKNIDRYRSFKAVVDAKLAEKEPQTDELEAAADIVRINMESGTGNGSAAGASLMKAFGVEFKDKFKGKLNADVCNYLVQSVRDGHHNI